MAQFIFLRHENYYKQQLASLESFAVVTIGHVTLSNIGCTLSDRCVLLAPKRYIDAARPD
jgi:hypothetical protein